MLTKGSGRDDEEWEDVDEIRRSARCGLMGHFARDCQGKGKGEDGGKGYTKGKGKVGRGKRRRRRGRCRLPKMWRSTFVRNNRV